MGAKHSPWVPFGNDSVAWDLIRVASEFNDSSQVELLEDSVKALQSADLSNPNVVRRYVDGSSRGSVKLTAG